MLDDIPAQANDHQSMSLRIQPNQRMNNDDMILTTPTNTTCVYSYPVDIAPGSF